MGNITPRRLTTDEQRVLRLLLDAWDGGERYLEQLPTLTVTSRCDCGCVTVSMDAEEGSVAPVLPVEATLVSDGGDPLGGVLIFERDGRIATLEAYSVGDDPLAAWPPSDQFQIHVR